MEYQSLRFRKHYFMVRKSKMIEEEYVCSRSFRAEERKKDLPEKTPSKSLPRHQSDDHKSPANQFMYSQLGRTVIKKHTYLTPITHATYPWNYAHPPGRKNTFKMPKTIYPKR